MPVRSCTSGKSRATGCHLPCGSGHLERTHVLPPAPVPEAVPHVAHRLDDPGDPLAGGGDRGDRADGLRDQRAPRRPGRSPPRVPDPLDPRGRPPAGRADARAQVHLRQAGDRGRVGHARCALRAPAAALVRLLRPAPDRAADVARDGRPADDPLLPRLRADLLRPARDHDRLRHRRPLLLRLAAGADRPRDHAAPRRRRVPLQPRLASRAARRAAEARRRRDRVGGVDRRHPRRQVVRPGGPGRGALPRRVGQRLHRERSGEHAASALRAAAHLPAGARPGGSPARRGALRRPGRPHDRRLLRLQPAADDARDAAAHARDVDRPGAARDCVGRAVLRGDRRARGGRGRRRRRRAAARARAASSSRASASATTPRGPCSQGSTSRSSPAARSR